MLDLFIEPKLLVVRVVTMAMPTESLRKSSIYLDTERTPRNVIEDECDKRKERKRLPHWRLQNCHKWGG